MTNRLRLVLAVLAISTLALSSFGVGLVLGHPNEPGFDIDGRLDRGEGLDVIESAYDEILDTSMVPPAPEDLARAAIDGMVDAIKRAEDPFAEFLMPDDRSMRELTTGRFSGIGVWLKPVGERVTIGSVLPDTPALRAGLQAGDVVRRVNGRRVSAISLQRTIDRIKGPEGTMVRLVLEREGEVFRVAIERASLELPSLTARLARDHVAYIRLFGFSRGAASQLREEVGRLSERGATGVILDLRGNGGGLFEEAIEVASVFIEHGRVVSLTRRSESDLHYGARGDAFEELALVVLVDGGSASASEIVAGALKDHDRATIVGVTTFGKAAVQNVVRFGDESGLKLTTGVYLTPDGHNITGSGIAPDVHVADPRFQRVRAFSILEGLLSS